MRGNVLARPCEPIGLNSSRRCAWEQAHCCCWPTTFIASKFDPVGTALPGAVGGILICEPASLRCVVVHFPLRWPSVNSACNMGNACCLPSALGLPSGKTCLFLDGWVGLGCRVGLVVVHFLCGSSWLIQPAACALLLPRLLGAPPMCKHFVVFMGGLAWLSGWFLDVSLTVPPSISTWWRHFMRRCPRTLRIGTVMP